MEKSVLKEIESLLEQFFSPSSTNEQKAEISKVLDQFSQQQAVWRYCVYFLQHSENQHVLMYALNLLENLVTQMWLSVCTEEKLELRHFLMQHVLTHYASMPPFLCKKIIRVIVLMGRADWPHQYPEFMTHIQQLMSSGDTSSLGLHFLTTMSEELASPRSDFITSQRQDELNTLMKQHVPGLLSLLMSLLDSVVERQRHTVAPTPPPSPNISPIRHTYDLSFPHSPPTHHLHSLTLLPSSAPSPPGNTSQHHLSLPHAHWHASAPSLSPPCTHTSSSSQATPTSRLGAQLHIPSSLPFIPLDSKTEALCVLSLKCLAHLFGWIPLSSLITPSILDTIFYFASLGCENIEDSSENSGNLGSLAMDCVNELLVRNCVPREFEAFLLKLFEKSFGLLQKLTGVTEKGMVCNFSQLDERFLAKCSDFFYWFVSSHLKRVEFNPLFPVLEFLDLFYKYSFKQPGIDSFCVCLDTWGVFLDHLVMMSTDTYGRQSPPPHDHYDRYKGVLIAMMGSILCKVQLHFNMKELREIDDDSIDDDNETEWQSFLRQCLEFVGKVSELFPAEAFQLILPLLENYSMIYLSLADIVHEQQGVKTMSINEGTECEKLHAVLKDLTSVLQAIGRLSEHFTGEHFVPRFSNAKLIVEKLCVIAKYSTDNMLFNVANPMPEVLDHNFIELHAQVLGTLRAFSHWLCQLNLDSLRSQQNDPSLQQLLQSFLSTLVDATAPLINEGIPEKITLSACQLLLSFASNVRPQFLGSLPAVRALMEKASLGKLSNLPSKASAWVYRCLAFVLILPWPELGDAHQQWDRRGRDIEVLITGATHIFCLIQQNPALLQNSEFLEQAKPSLKQALLLLEDLTSSVSDERPKSKSLLFKSLSSSVEVCISLFPLFLSQPDMLDLLMSFFLTLFKSLKAQVGQTLTEKTTQTFMSLLTKDLLEQTFTDETSHGFKVIIKFLRILQLLVQDSTGTENQFLPSIISFVMNQIYPFISEKAAPDINTVLYELLYLILLNNWRYFFPTNVLNHMDGHDNNHSIDHEQEFFSIMESFGHSFLQPDIAVFKQNLVSIESLNSKHKLYSKVQFRGCMLYPLLQLLLQVLIQKSHDLLQEEICSCIYSMAAVDFTFYHTEFLMKFVTSVEELSAEQQRDLLYNYKGVEDLPSFVRYLRQFASDLRYFLIRNKCVPEGMVKLS